MSVYREGRAPPNTCPRCMEVLLALDDAPGCRTCEKCGGIFADIATSQRILETLDRQLLAIGFEKALGKKKPRDDGRTLSCPECQIGMVKNRIESAACEIDACPVHGTWFDTHELVDVMRAFERARKKGILLTHDRPSTPLDLDTYGEDDAPMFRALVAEWFRE